MALAIPTPYRGRFAPTPSGPLHLGSLLTAVASWLQARTAGGQWLLRLDDLDTARCVPGADAEIQRQLEAHGLQWDESPRRQSAHREEYRAAFEDLRARGRLYACDCTRARLAAENRATPLGAAYSGRCRARALEAGAWRLRVPAHHTVRLDDAWQGALSVDAEADLGDFTLRRADGEPGYQLACVLDEAAQGITEVVRGADLLDSTLRQCVLMDLLNLRRPAYRHLPVLNDARGRKLSKQNHAPALVCARASEQLRIALNHLDCSVPPALDGAPPPELLAWALTRWPQARIPSLRSFPVE